MEMSLSHGFLPPSRNTPRPVCTYCRTPVVRLRLLLPLQVYVWWAGVPTTILPSLSCRPVSVNQCQSASLPATRNLRFRHMMAGPLPSLPHPMQCCDCRIALWGLCFFTRLLAS